MKLFLKNKEKIMKNKKMNAKDSHTNIDKLFDDICYLRGWLHEHKGKWTKFRNELKLDAESLAIAPNDTDVQKLEIESLDELSKGQDTYINLLELFIYKTHGKTKLNNEMAAK